MYTAEMSASERKEVMAVMESSFGEQQRPKVGIFWYDETEDRLFGVSSSYADQVPFNSNGVKTERTLHKTWWKKQQERLKAKGVPPGIFAHDYTTIPRGRIFQFTDGHYELMCGSWINEHIIELVKDEFNLWDVIFKVTADIHWEIGHGWSEEYL